jgi:exosortase
MTRLDDRPIRIDATSVGAARWLTPAFAIQLAILAGLLAFHYGHVFHRLSYIWQNSGDWSHGFLIPVFSVYYLYLQRERMPRGLRDTTAIARVVGALLLMLAFVIYLRSTLVQQEYPKCIALVMSVMGIVLMVGGWPMARWSWFAVAFLMFAMPLPETLYAQLTIPLRNIAARVSAGCLSILPGMMAEAQGTIVEYMYDGRTGNLDVENACSGMRLLVTMSALGVAMAFVSDRPLWQRMIMILACVPISVFCNMIRVTTTGFLYVFGKTELASGVPHMILGLGMLFLAFGLYGGISYVLGHMFVEGEAE